MSQFIPGDFFHLRTPTLPWDVIAAWCEGLESISAHTRGGDLEAALARDRGILRSRLRELVLLPEVRAALRAASPSLCARLPAWLEGDDSDAARIELPLVRYLMRMAGRATPFGLFAGTTFGKLGDRTRLVVPERGQHRRHTRVNLDCLIALAVRLSQNAEFLPHIRFRANETAYEAGGRHRYYALRLERNSRTYRLCDIERSPFAEVALSAARRNDGATVAEIADAVVAAADGIQPAEALEYVRGLVRVGLLCSTLIPPVTGRDGLGHLIEELRKIPPAADVAATLESIGDDLATLDAEASVSDDDAPDVIAGKLQALSADIDVSRPTRVDLRKPCDGVTLSRTIAEEIAKGVEVLAAITPERDGALEKFAVEFEARYQGREVPLLEVLDVESGIGFEQPRGSDPSALVKDLKFLESKHRNIKWDARSRFLLEKLTGALATGASEIQLSAADIKALSRTKALPPPPGQAAMVILAATSDQALADGNFQLLMNGVGGDTSGRLLGRFLHDDTELAAHTRAALRREEAHAPDVIHAEIAHHLQGTATNVNCRPVLRDYEIDVAGGSGAPAPQRLPLTDLLVSVKNGRIELRSRQHGKRVVPHLSSAHSFHLPGFPGYRFLAHLQEQGFSCDAGWSWGAALREAPFLPRVRYGKLVLSLASWRIPAARLDPVQALRGSDRFRAMQELRAERKLPRFVRLTEGDNLLPVDLDNVLSIDSMLGVCKRLPSVTCTEVFPEAHQLIARGRHGSFHHELVVPLLRAPASAPAPSISGRGSIEPRPDLARRPGDDWLYLQLYCGMATLDRLLVELVAPLIRELRAEGAIKHWFFIRYDEGGCHMRLRLQGEARTLWTQVAPRVLAASSSMRSLVHRVALDTYDPEVERYGGREAHAIAEQVFDADSEAALAVVERYRTDPEARWRIALAGMSAILDDLSFSIEEKQQIAAQAREGQGDKLRASPEVAHQLGERFRPLRADVDALVAGLTEPYSEAKKILARRSAALQRLAPQLRDLNQRGRLTVSMSSIAVSYLHMWANRVFRGSQNVHEYVLYDFLCRAYRGARARAKTKSAPAILRASPGP